MVDYKNCTVSRVRVFMDVAFLLCKLISVFFSLLFVFKAEIFLVCMKRYNRTCIGVSKLFRIRSKIRN